MTDNLDRRNRYQVQQDNLQDQSGLVMLTGLIGVVTFAFSIGCFF